MNRKYIFAIAIWSIIGLIFSTGYGATAHAQNAGFPVAKGHTWYVAPSGTDLDQSGALERPVRTIQYAIDRAASGDTIIVLEGLYTGAGNTNLDFKGKAVILQSRDPEDNTCLQHTLIDAEGVGVIARFTHDEGPAVQMTGFSLGAGDVSVLVRGIAGFFELSGKANPTLRRLRILENRPPSTESLRQSPAEILPPYGGRVWDGNNPFHQPAKTTDYYGSGDVNKDGALTASDASLAQEMVNLAKPPTYRADVDGNGLVEANDVALINQALSGGILPGWWNSLPGRAEREAWLTKIMAVDRTNEHPYINGWFVCGNFAHQLFIHSSFLRSDMSFTPYDGGQTFFNIPMYTVTTIAYAGAHSINAILVGNDPTLFEDWRFLEPQTDMVVHPGDWSMMYNTDVTIHASDGYDRAINKIIFHVTETENSLVWVSPDLILARPSPGGGTPDNRPDLWNPRMVPVSTGLLLFERAREDQSHTTDIHVAGLPLDSAASGAPVTMTSQFSRLLDAYLDENGAIHLIWFEDHDYQPGLYYGKLDPLTHALGNISRVTPDVSMPREGRVAVTSAGDIHILWYDMPYGIFFPYEEGIYWTRWTGAAWQAPQRIIPAAAAAPEKRPELAAGDSASLLDWERPNSNLYRFDVAVSRDGKIDLGWAEPKEWNSEFRSAVKYMQYDQGWGSPATLFSTADFFYYPMGVAIARDSINTLHLAYWMGGGSSLWGNLIHHTYNGVVWSPGSEVDSGGSAGYPALEADSRGAIHLAWSRKTGDQALTVIRKFALGSWQPEQVLLPRPDANALYPAPLVLPDGNLLVSWSSRSPDWATIETQLVPQPALDHITVTSDADSGPGSLRWAIAGIKTGGTIDFDLPFPATITLTSGELVLDKDMEIHGPGRHDLVINGNNATRIFNVEPGMDISVTQMTITHGFARHSAGEVAMKGGGAILNQGNLAIADVSLASNEADFGGAITSSSVLTITGSLIVENRGNVGAGIHNSGVLTITNSNLSANDTAGIGDGGGIYNDGILTLKQAILSGNHARGGGGLLNWAQGHVTIQGTELSANTAGNGGGIENGEQGVIMIADGSNISSNIATFIGGGAANFGGFISITDSIVKSNVTTADSGLYLGGGGIYNFDTGTVDIFHSEVSANKSIFGGGIYNAGGSLSLIDVKVVDNQAIGTYNNQIGQGGGIMTIGGVVWLEKCTVQGNLANSPNAGYGGGIYNGSGALTILDCMISGNGAGGWHDYRGGGIYNAGTLTLSSSTVHNNFISGQYGTGISGGGGLYNDQGTASISNSTISANTGNVGTGGAGIYNQGGPVTLLSCTITENSGYLSGGLEGGITLGSTIVAKNYSASPGRGNCHGGIVSLGYNLEDTDTCGLHTPGDLANTDPRLDVLGNNGGPTPTYALKTGSPAIDAGDPAAYPPVDQRGIHRPIDGNKDGAAVADIGSFELNFKINLPLIRK